MSGPTLIAVGDNCLDVYLTKNQMAVGGNALNVAVQWRALGMDARYLGMVGRDPEGDLILDGVSRAGLNADDIERTPGQTAVTLIHGHNGDRRFLHEDLGVGLNYQPDLPRLIALDSAAWVHLGTNANPDLIRHLLRRNIRFSVDVSTAHDQVPLDGVPLVFASGPEDTATAIEPLMAQFRAKGALSTIITCGMRGAFYDDGHTIHRVHARQVKVVDTCGAGDSFIASFIVEHMVRGLPASTALRHATESAARTCGHEGGFPQTLAAIPAWLLDKYADVIASAKD